MDASVQRLMKDLVRKSRLQRGVHSYYHKKTRRLSLVARGSTIVASAVMATLAVVDPEVLTAVGLSMQNPTRNAILGIIGFLLFLVNLLIEVFDVNGRYLRHGDSIEQYSKLLRDMRAAHLESEPVDTRAKLLAQYSDRYMLIAGASISMSDTQFEKGRIVYTKRCLLMLARKDLPFGLPWKVRKLAGSKHLEWNTTQEEL